MAKHRPTWLGDLGLVMALVDVVMVISAVKMVEHHLSPAAPILASVPFSVIGLICFGLELYGIHRESS